MKIKISSSNLNQKPLDWKRNYINIKKSIEKSIKKDVKILCLPELSITGYGCQDLFLNKWVIDNAKLELIKIKNLCNNIAILNAWLKNKEHILYYIKVITCFLNK